MASDLLPPAPVTVTDSAVNDTVLPLCFASSDRPLAGDGHAGDGSGHRQIQAVAGDVADR